MFTTMLFAGPGTYLWRETTIVCVCALCSVWRRREDNIDKQLLDSLFGHQPLIINHNNKYIIQSYPCCHLTGGRGGGGEYSKCLLLLPKHTSILQYIFAYNFDTMPYIFSLHVPIIFVRKFSKLSGRLKGTGGNYMRYIREFLVISFLTYIYGFVPGVPEFPILFNSTWPGTLGFSENLHL
jgi:hypothetical protein